ncbi:MAG: ABC transporter permease [Actinobacteria bacterium]|nr:ABC transporter permease [Actinomycetota bacterium]
MPKRLISLPKQALRAILTNKGRSFLTVLGIVIGIASVIALVSLGNGVQASITKRISTLGSSNVTVIPGGGFGPGYRTQQGGQGSSGQGDRGSDGGGMEHPGSGGPVGGGVSSLTFDDLKSLQTGKHPQIKAVTGGVTGSVILKKDGQDRRYSVSGTSASYFSINNLTTEKGSLFKEADENAKSRSVVLGNDMASDLYGSKNPVGRTIAIGNEAFEVTGVLKKVEESGFSNPNAQSFIPNTTASDTFGSKNLSSITVQAKSDKDVDAVKADVKKVILANHKITDAKLADFSVTSARDMLSIMDQVTGILTSFLAGIAAISLVVGGIGIMNIMLVSVTERTREIGLRKAVGARTFDIVSQFLVEAVILTLLGGLIGMALGAFIARTAANMIGFSAVITANAVLLAVGVSSAVGLVFGLYPAVKASRLNPIDALRYE